MAEELLLKFYRKQISYEVLINWLQKKETAVDLINNDSDRLDFVKHFLSFLRDNSAIQKQDLIHSGLTPRKQPLVEASKTRNERSDKENNVESPNVILPRSIVNEDVLPDRQKSSGNRSRHRLSLGNFLTKVHSKLETDKTSPNILPLIPPVAPYNLNDEENFPAIGSPSVKKINAIQINRRINPTRVSKQRSMNSNGNINAAFAITNDVQEECTSLNNERLLLRKERINIQNETSLFEKLDKDVVIEKVFSTKIENVELSDVSSKSQLDDFAKLYAYLIEDHLVPSLFLELYFIFQLLTVPGVEVRGEVDLGLKTLFVSASNCVYFATRALLCLKKLLKFLDKSTIKHLSENCRVQTFCPRLIIFFKNHLDSIKNETKIVISPNSIQGVAFHSETDNRRNFANDQEFQLFKKKRDIFYGLIREWESKKDDPIWLMELALGSKIKSLIELGKHPSTFIFFTRLFSAQLVIMCKDDFQADFDVLENIISLKKSNLEKLKMLEKRFHIPFKFGGALPPPTFPSYQEFFKTFICVASSSTFNQHLTDVLASEITELHSSLMKHMNEFTEGQTCFDPLLKTKVLTMLMTLKLLSKFLGLVIFLPYSNSETMSKDAEKLILSVRKSSRPILDFNFLMDSEAKNETKFFIIFWLVDFLSMMDSIAPKICYYQLLIQNCFDMYRYLRVKSSYSFVCFRLILEWLFQNNRLLCRERILENICSGINEESPILNDFLKVFDQQVLYLVCPYLSELKQLLLNFNQGTGSNSSSTRKIKPTTSSPNSSFASFKQLQVKLEENFLHNQPTSVKGLVEFVSDMISSNIIRHTQSVIIPEFKKGSSDKLNRIRIILKGKNDDSLKLEKFSLANELVNLASSMTTDIKETVINYTKRYCDTYISPCIRPLIPNNILKPVEEVIVHLIICSISQRVEEWINGQVNENILYNEMLQEVQKHHKDALLSGANSGNEFKKIHDSKLPFPSQVISATKNLVKNLWTVRGGIFTLEDISNNINLMTSILENRQDVSQLTMKIALQLNIDLAISIAYQQPDLLDDHLENSFLNLWLRWKNQIGPLLIGTMKRYCNKPKNEKLTHFYLVLIEHKLIDFQDSSDYHEEIKIFTSKSLLQGCLSSLSRYNGARQMAKVSFEPDYLDALKPAHPIYDCVNVCTKSYDFTVIERYSRFVHKTANKMGLNVTETWATPPRVYQIDTFKPRSTLKDQAYKLFLYERNVQISEFPCYLMPVFAEFIRASLPEGAQLSIHNHEKEHEEMRYIPDTQLNELKTQLGDIVEPPKSNTGKKK